MTLKESFIDLFISKLLYNRIKDNQSCLLIVSPVSCVQARRPFRCQVCRLRLLQARRPFRRQARWLRLTSAQEDPVPLSRPGVLFPVHGGSGSPVPDRSAVLSLASSSGTVLIHPVMSCLVHGDSSGVWSTRYSPVFLCVCLPCLVLPCLVFIKDC